MPGMSSVKLSSDSPAGFENYFREVAAAWGDLERFGQINAKYSLDRILTVSLIFANVSG